MLPFFSPLECDTCVRSLASSALRWNGKHYKIITFERPLFSLLHANQYKQKKLHENKTEQNVTQKRNKNRHKTILLHFHVYTNKIYHKYLWKTLLRMVICDALENS